MDRQPGGQQGGEVVGHPAHDVCDEVVAVVRHGDGRVDDAVEFPDRGLHFAQLDAEALELHLVVGPAGELQLPVQRAAGEVARVVHAGAVGRERVRHEPARGEPRPAQVAERHLVTGDVDGADPARRHRPQPVVEQMDDHAGDRTADRADVVTGGEVLVGQHPVGDMDGGLGDAVHVDQLGRSGAVPLDPAAQPPEVQRLAAEDDPAQRGDRFTGVPVGLDEPVERRRGLVEDGHPALADQPVEVDRGAGQRVLRHQQLAAVHQGAPQLPDREVEGEGVELDPYVVGAEAHVGGGVGEERHHTGVRDGDALGPSGRAGGVDHVRGVVRGGVGPGGGLRQLVPLDEHPGLHVRAGQQPGEAVPLFRVHEHDLRGGVGEDVLQPLVRVRQVQRHVRAARGDGRDQGDDLLHGARDGDGDPLAGADPRRAQDRRQLGLGVGQFAVAQGPGGTVQGALGDGGGPRITVCGGVEQLAQGRRGDRRRAPGGVRGRGTGRGVRAVQQAGEGLAEGAQDRLGARLAQQLTVVDQVEARPAVGRALHHQGQRVVRGTLVDDPGDGEGVVVAAQRGHVGRDVEDHQGVEEGAGAGLLADPGQ
ncbi:hypothetical protein GCM10009647_016400 [Streptomyces sanglieri]